MDCSCEDNADGLDMKQKMNGQLYRALMEGKANEAIMLCRRVPDHALHIVTINEDTILHMATYAKESQLAVKLLDELPDHHLDKLTRQNGVGNTILHEAATSDHAVPIADRVLKKAPGLLGMRNQNGETALFRAARYGKFEIFNFLDAKIAGQDQTSRQFYLQRSDKTTVLHSAILSKHFDLAYQIANDYNHLIGEKDADGMTALQLLACDSSAFKLEDDDQDQSFLNLVKLCCSTSQRQLVRDRKQRYKWAVKLAKFLVARDTSWELTYSSKDISKPKIHKYGSGTDVLSSMEKGGSTSTGALGREVEIGETPLTLATKSGIVEIVKEILKLYPQAVEYIDDEGRNILHVSIKYRQLKIFELVKEMEVPMRRLARKFDNNGNTILHTVGLKRQDVVAERMQGPAFLLQEELLWFERVEEVTPLHFKHHMNQNKQTAYDFFVTANSELRNLSKEWLKSTSEGCSVVAVLIATVAFAAAYTVPGGNKEENGLPVLGNQPLFVAFTITDVLSLTFSLTAVVTFLSILSSPYRFKDFKNSLPNKLMMGFTFLFLSVAMMMVAFGATIILMIHNKESWTKIAFYSISFIPVGIFALSHFPLYSSLTKTHRYLLGKIKKSVPLKSICNLFKYGNLQNPTATFSSSSFP